MNDAAQGSGSDSPSSFHFPPSTLHFPLSTCVELVSTGSELLSGRTVNTHAQTLANKIRPFGLRLTRDTTVPDDLAAIEEAVRGALTRVDMVFVSGGLGGTSDDLTREALGRITGAQPVIHAGSLAAMEKRYVRMGRPVTAVAKRQTQILTGSVGLLNPAGIAPGMMLQHTGKIIFVLPGPPPEFVGVMESGIFPKLRELGLPISQTLEQLFMCTGLGETEIAERLEKIGLPTPEIEVGYCAHAGQTEVRLAAAPGQAVLLEQQAAAVRTALGMAVFAEERITLEEAVGRRLAARKQTLAVAESCTGGLVGHRLTQIAGSSAYFLGGIIAYSNASKIRELGVAGELIERQGAVSEEVAHAMANGVRTRFSADYGLAITGIAGPEGGTAEKPVGTVWVAVADASGTVAQLRQFTSVRETIKQWSSQLALDLLRRRLP